MKTSYFLRGFLFWLSFLAFISSSCSSEPKDTIIGKWQEVEGTETMEFFKEGTVTIDPDDMPPLKGRYVFIEKDQIQIELDRSIGRMIGAMTLKVQIAKNELTTTDGSGNSQKYRRVFGNEPQKKIATEKNMGKAATSAKSEKSGGEVESAPKRPGIKTIKPQETYFSFAGIKWDDSPNQIARKLEEIGAKVTRTVRGQIAYKEGGTVYAYPSLSGIEEPNLLYMKKFGASHKDTVSLRSMLSYTENSSNKVFNEAIFNFLESTNLLVCYKIRTEVDGPELMKQLEDKYGPYQKRLKCRGYGGENKCPHFMWEKEDQFMVVDAARYSRGSIIYYNNKRLQEIAEKLRELVKEAEKNKAEQKKLF